jgi:hypothetical protein
MASIAHDVSVFHLVTASGTNATLIATSLASPSRQGVRLLGYYIYNQNTAARKVAFHDTNSAPTAGAAVKFSIMIPAQSAANLSLVDGILFDKGLAITTVTGMADSDSTGVSNTDLGINLYYKQG